MDALVSGLVRTVLGNLNSVALQEIGLAWGLKKELDKLESVLNTIQLVLNDAETKQRKSEPLRNWLQKLKHAAYDAENILDEVATESLLRKDDPETGQIHKLNAFISRRNPLLFKFKIAHKVKRIRERLDVIAKERHNFHLGEGVVLESRIGYMSVNRQTGSLVNELEIYGKNEERDLIIEKVIHGACDRDGLSVYAICGMGGIGKTTLAQLVYNDERVKKHFELRIWVCVSDDFSALRLIKAIMQCIDRDVCNVSELDPLQQLLQEKLKGKRFLLVLDDVWNENSNLWDGLKETIRCAEKGSVVVVTSRIRKVATMMSTIGIHHVQFLSEEDSWSVFSRRAFAIREREETYMEEIGKEIVKKCGGVPLAIKALGSLMGYKSSKSEWLAIQASETWQILNDEEGVLPVLRLSYDNLSMQLRQCFVYCCIYPKDYEIGEDQLIQLWMANGYLSSGDETDLYLAGRLIFKELIWRSFFQDVKKDFEGNVVCKLHDLMHDLAESVMRNETYIVENEKTIKFPKTLRHFYVGHTPLKLPINMSLWSLIGKNENFLFEEENFPAFLSKQKYLRVLYFQFGMVRKLPSIIFDLQHLRYLAIECGGLKRLPESLTRLQNLQTLVLKETYSLVELPKGMKCLKNLYFIDIGSCPSLVSTPPELRELTCLLKLSTFIVGLDSAHHINQLMDLNLGGDLDIRGLDCVRGFEDAKSANLMEKSNMTSLSLSWKENNELESAEYFEEVLKGLQPNENIEKIRINFYQGTSFPRWMSTVFYKNLKDISLKSCWKCEHLPPFGTFPSLECLKLYKMDSVKRLGAEWNGDGDCTFPALTRLTIGSMCKLEEWTKPLSVVSFPCLTNLDIQGCPLLSNNHPPFGTFPSLKCLKLYKMDSVKRLGAEWHGDGECTFPALTSLTIKSMDNLEEWTTPLSVVSFPCLTDLDIQGCPKLRGIPCLSNLKKLKVSNSKNTRLLISIMDLTSITSLELESSLEVDVLPVGLLRNHKALKSLYIIDSSIKTLGNELDNLSTLQTLFLLNCSNLEVLPDGLRHLNSLESLTIRSCHSLVSIPAIMFQGLSSLKDLSIHSCKKLKDPLSGPLPSTLTLQSLSIYEFQDMEALPECMQQLTCMRDLNIKNCANLRSLPNWIGSLQSLSKMEIDYCKNLRSLPNSFQNLKSMRMLTIIDCPHLAKRCKKPDGEDWPKIQHIPKIRITNLSEIMSRFRP